MPSDKTSNGDSLKSATARTSGNRPGSEKQRVVFGLFDDSVGVKAALMDLLSAKFNTENLCVVGTCDAVTLAVSALQQKRNANSRLIELLTYTEPFKAAPDSQVLVGSRGVLLQQLNAWFQTHQLDESLSVSSNRLKIIAELVVQMEQGRLSLIVNASAPRQLIHASRVLLRRSTYAIQTLEFLLKPKVTL